MAAITHNSWLKPGSNNINLVILNRFTFEFFDKIAKTFIFVFLFLLKINTKVGEFYIVWYKT